jgi:hypothetical protein
MLFDLETRYTHHTLGVCAVKSSQCHADRRKTYEVRACNGDNSLYVVLKASVKPLSDSPARLRPNLLQPNRDHPGHVQEILPTSYCVDF